MVVPRQNAIRGHMTARLPWILGIVFALAVLLTRTWGIHVDEIGYFHLAVHEHLGDTATTGKPYVFYAFNNALYHLFRRSAGWLHPLILPVFYVIVTVLALWQLAMSASLVGARRGWTFALLLLSPFVLFNATQLMMETALLPLLSVTLAVLLSTIGERQRPRAALWLGIAAAASAMVKDTALPALLVMGVAFFPAMRFRLWPLAAGSLAGTLGSRFLLWAIYAPPSFHYGGVSQFLASFGDPRQWTKIPSYLGMWIFFVGAAWIGAIWSLRERCDTTSRTLLAVASLSAGGVLLVQFATNPDLAFPRYAYPVIWVGLASSAIACGRSRTLWPGVAVLALQLPWITGLWPGTFPTIRYWPALVTDESYSSGGTILSGTPVYGWIAASPRALSDLCVYLPTSSAAGVNEAEEWFQDVAAHVGFYDEQAHREFERCSGAKALVDRRFTVNACETEACDPSRYWIRSCLRQDIRFYSARTGAIQSRVCLP
jgi:hypothetical protein